MTTIPPDMQEVLDVLQQVADETLKRKHRLGHHAVVWHDDQVMALGGTDAPDHLPKLELKSEE